MTKSINPPELRKRLTGVEAPSLIDVRRKTDYEAYPKKIAGAVWRDPEKIEDWVKDLPSDASAVVYCVKGGSVSQSVADRLQKEGREVEFLEGGLKAWTENGQSVEDTQPSQDSDRIQASDMDLLKKAGVSENDITHSRKVAGKALEIAGRSGANLNMKLVGRGALFHDLGKAQTHALEHGKIGAELGRKLGLPEAVTAIMEKHIRGGLTTDEAVELGLPVKDYTLNVLEERIIIYADRLVDIISDGIVSINSEQEAEDRFEEILRTYPKYGKNEITLNRYLGYHREIQGLIKGHLPNNL
jgi:uncharacterized protein